MAFVVLAVLVTTPIQAAPFAAIVMDARTGEILYEKNARTRLHPASLTKMMTLYIVFQELQAGRLTLDTKVTVSKYAASQPPSRLGLKQGQKIAVRYLIRAAAVKSANDAAAALGDHISGDHVAFAKRMTRTARQLGMHDTTFKNAHGLTAEGHLSTAYDMNVLGRHLFYDFPQYYNIFSRRTADAGIATVTNTNSRFLDNYEGADGIKTGYTSPAGFNLTASAKRGNKRIIATVFGGTSTANRNAKMMELMDLGFGAARNRVKEQPPVAPHPDEALIASAEPQIDEIDAEGGAGKTIRISGAVTTSPRPKARPEVPTVPDAVAVAMAAGIEGALAEATAEPAPAGTLDFQAEAIAAGEPPVPEAVAEAPVDVAAAEEAADPVADTLIAEAAQAEPGTLDAQASALAAGTAPVDTVVAELAPDPALAEIKPMPRPDTIAAKAPVEPAPSEPAPVAVAETTETPAAPAAEEVQLAAVEPAPELPAAELPAPELVVTDPGLVDAPPAELTVAETAMPEVTAVETVAAAATVTPVEPAPARRAPIFDAVEVAEAEEPAPTEEVVVVMSTSGGRHFGVNVGEYGSRYDAERALLKTALAESATLNEGLRKTTQTGGAWRASFMGLTEEQAELACRRLRARAVPCETVGG
ncbi:MAG: serine hydrolase [Tabrizicola sp.]|nr:serine hydrolase [Tabrizicola sp.]